MRLLERHRRVCVDVDGTLVRTNILHTYAYYAMNRGALWDMAKRTVRIPVTR